jgi:hypothetical protein
VQIIPWISKSRCLTPISAFDPAYIWLQSRQDPLQGSTTSCGAQATADYRTLISVQLQLLSGYPLVPTASHVGNAQTGCIWFQGFIQVYKNQYLFVVFIW